MLINNMYADVYDTDIYVWKADGGNWWIRLVLGDLEDFLNI